MKKKGTGPWAHIARELKRRYLRRLLRRYDWHAPSVARHIGIDRNHLHTLLDQLDLRKGKRPTEACEEKAAATMPVRDWFGVRVSP